MNSDSQHELCELFQQFYQEHQHPFVPPYPEFDHLYSLAARARKHRANLSAGVVDFLDQHSFNWTATNRFSRWMYNYFQLKRFFDEQGNSDVPQHFPINKRLGTWAYLQRGRKEKLTPWQVTMLDKLNFSWIDGSETYTSPIYQDRWDTMFEKLRQFKDQYGHVMVPSTYTDPSLARWVVRQRKAADRLSSDQIKRLEALGFVFDMQLHRDLLWEYMYQQLVLFYQEEGHSAVPQNYPNNRRLANWVRTQRVAKQRLSQEKVAKLTEIGFEFSADWVTSLDQQWLSNFRKVESYYQKHGNLSIPDKRLYRWIYKQKQRKPGEEYRRVLLRKLGIDHTD